MGNATGGGLMFGSRSWARPPSPPPQHHRPSRLPSRLARCIDRFHARIGPSSSSSSSSSPGLGARYWLGLGTVKPVGGSRSAGRSRQWDGYTYEPCNTMSDDDLGESKELVGNSPTQKNWRGILIALLVILIVCSLIVTAVILVTPKHEDEVLGGRFTFEDVFNKNYFPRHFTAQWVGDKDIYVYRSREGELMEYDAELNKTNIIMNNGTFRRKETDSYFVSEDLKYVLIADDVERVYRYSFTAKYVIYNRHETDPHRKIEKFPQERKAGEWDRKKLQYAGWAPKGNALTFVCDHNLYYQARPDETPIQITSDGSYGTIFNGIPDWVYEEEILRGNKAHWMSPEGKFIAYATIDDSKVPIYQYPYYGDGRNYYGAVEEIAYPKAGDWEPGVSPRVTISLFETEKPGKRVKILNPPDNIRSEVTYFTKVSWHDENRLMIVWSNRPQNVSFITICLADTGECFLNSKEVVSHGWVEMSDPIFLQKENKYMMILPENDGTSGFWRHIAMVTTPLGREGMKHFLTHGMWDVTDLLAFDEEEGYVYYISTNSDPRKRYLFRVKYDSLDPATLHQPECLTCDYSPDCEYISASFSKKGNYYILNCQGPGVPHYVLKSTHDDRHIVVEDNAELKVRLEKIALPKREYFEIDLNLDPKDRERSYVVHAQVYLPPILNEDHLTQYPLLIHTYGAPDTQQVTDRFMLDWATYMTSTENVIYAAIDGRGAGGRGSQFKHEVYGRLGTVEVLDQIIGARWFRDKLPYVDKERIAIWGWSYGGFVTAHAVGHPDNDVITCGVAVAPVTDWRYYDTVYTERYMGLNVGDNYRHYDNANVSAKAANFRDKNFMLVHGTADDNVHFQHTAQLVKALTEADVDFRIQMYADKNHGISGETTSKHLYRTIRNFLMKECWNGGKPRITATEAEAEAAKKIE